MIHKEYPSGKNGFKEYLISEGYSLSTAIEYAKMIELNEQGKIKTTSKYNLHSALRAYGRFLLIEDKKIVFSIKYSEAPIRIRKTKCRELIPKKPFTKLEGFYGLRKAVLEAGYTKTSASLFNDVARALVNFTNKSLMKTTEDDVNKFLETKKDLKGDYINNFSNKLNKILLFVQGKKITKDRRGSPRTPIIINREEVLARLNHIVEAPCIGCKELCMPQTCNTLFSWATHK